MKFAIFGRTFPQHFGSVIQGLFDKLGDKDVNLTIYAPFLEFLRERIDLPFTPDEFNSYEDLTEKPDIMICIGGDGTFLEAITHIRNAGTPILGMNTGRLGFLANTSEENIYKAIEKITNGEFELEKRSLVEVVKPEPDILNNTPFALNEFTVHKKDSSSMLSVEVYLNDENLNTYYSDGLIIATPTGSTAYSLSCGGPVVSPGCKNFVITPIAPHNINVRPVVVQDNTLIKLRISGRNDNILLTLDSRNITMNQPLDIELEKADFMINMIKLENKTYFDTLKNKLIWGVDKRI
ncbi:MAG: NAD kinase [Flavobacteriales bacterium]